jgi:hypothetical protein
MLTIRIAYWRVVRWATHRSFWRALRAKRQPDAVRLLHVAAVADTTLTDLLETRHRSRHAPDE